MGGAHAEFKDEFECVTSCNALRTVAEFVAASYGNRGQMTFALERNLGTIGAYGRIRPRRTASAKLKTA